MMVGAGGLVRQRRLAAETPGPPGPGRPAARVRRGERPRGGRLGRGRLWLRRAGRERLALALWSALAAQRQAQPVRAPDDGVLGERVPPDQRHLVGNPRGRYLLRRAQPARAQVGIHRFVVPNADVHEAVMTTSDAWQVAVWKIWMTLLAVL